MRNSAPRALEPRRGGEGPTILTRAAFLIQALGLQRHPERGHFVRTYAAPLMIDAKPHGGPRPASTAIYFLLGDDERATYLHRLVSDELFHLYEGGPLEVLLLSPDGSGQVACLGLDLGAGERPQLVIPAGTWFAAELAPETTHCLWGCTVAPGFDFADFEMAKGADELATRYPAFAERIGRLVRP